MTTLVSKENIELDIAEKQNVVNILIGNFASQIANIATAENEEEYREFQVSLEIASTQLGKFVSNLIVENGNLHLENLKET